MPLNMTHSLLDYLPDYHYCETALLAGTGWEGVQLLNMLSNAVIISYALLLRHRAKFKSEPSYDLLYHYALLWLGFGSILWHFSAHKIFLLWDISGVLILLLIFIHEVSIKMTAYFIWRVRIFLFCAVIAVFYAGNHILMLPMNAGGFVGFALILLFAGGRMLFSGMLRVGSYLTLAGGLLAGGLLMRAYDLRLCEDWAFGTHFIWHILVYLAIITVIEMTGIFSDKSSK